MTIIILYEDLRNKTSIRRDFTINWKPRMTAKHAIQDALGEKIADSLEHDLMVNNKDLIIGWYNTDTEEHSNVGGIGNLDWELPDNSHLTVCYEDKDTTESQRDESFEWLNRILPPD